MSLDSIILLVIGTGAVGTGSGAGGFGGAGGGAGGGVGGAILGPSTPRPSPTPGIPGPFPVPEAGKHPTQGPTGSSEYLTISFGVSGGAINASDPTIGGDFTPAR